MKPLVKISLRYGVLAGIIGSVLMVGLYYIGRHPFLIPVFMDFRIFLFGIFIFFTLRELRDVYQNGILYFWQGVFASFLFTLSYAILASVLLFLFIHFVPAFLADYISLSIEQLRALPADVIQQIGKDVYVSNLEMLPATRSRDLAFLYFSQSFMISLFISIILSVILRKQPKT
jgi:hypothetical protein